MGTTVLIIEDDRLLRLTLTAFLEDCGYRTVEADNGREGLEMIGSIEPDIVVTDLRMPVMDGFAVIAALHQNHPELPVIAITGTGDTGAIDEALQLGASACLHKPITELGTLSDAIVAALRRRPAGT